MKSPNSASKSDEAEGGTEEAAAEGAIAHPDEQPTLKTVGPDVQELAAVEDQPNLGGKHAETLSQQNGSEEEDEIEIADEEHLEGRVGGEVLAEGGAQQGRRRRS